MLGAAPFVRAMTKTIVCATLSPLEVCAVSELIPIDEIESKADPKNPEEGFVPQVLADDPDLGDGSSSREGYNVASWRLHTLKEDSLVGMTEYEGDDRRSRNARRAQQASRDARTKEERVARRRAHVRTGVILVLILVVVTSVAVTYALELWGGKSVPNVEGLTQARAVQLLEEKGFDTKIETAPADLLEGRVVEFSPEAGTRLEEGSTISLLIGTSRIMPDVVGSTQEEATEELRKAGANNVRVEPKVTREGEEGIVQEVRPAAGSVFISTEEILLVVSQLPRVPDVTDMDEKHALEAFERAELPVKVTYERGTADDRLKVIRTEPAIGERVEGDEEITLVMGEALINPVRVEDYFDVTLPEAQPFLTSEGYALKASAKAEGNHAIARFESPNDAHIAFLAEPWTHVADAAKGVAADAIGPTTRVDGVRLVVEVNREPVAEAASAQVSQAQSDADEDDELDPTKTTSKGLALLGLQSAPINEETARSVMELCGLDGMLGSCTDKSITLPPDVERAGHSVYCCYGESGDRVWTVLLANSTPNAAEASRIVVTCVPKHFFNSEDLVSGGTKICDFVAYVDEYAE